MSTTTATPTVKRTSRADRNYLSCAQGSWTLFAGTPDVEPCDPLPDGGIVDTASPQEWDSLLKVTRTTGLKLERLEVAQGRENSLDINNLSRSVNLDGDWGWSDSSGTGMEGDQVITVKGGSSHITISGGVFSRGRNATVVVGQWSDQSTAPCTDLDFSGLRPVREDEPLTFILVRAKRVKLPPGAKVLRWKSALFTAYVYAKMAAVKLGFFR